MSIVTKVSVKQPEENSGGTIDFDLIYPVGSVYLSVSMSTTDQVEVAFGGTWVAWGAGRVPVGVDTSQTEFNTVEKTGGEKTHTLSVDEMPSHSHSLAGMRIYQSGGTHAWPPDQYANSAVESGSTGNAGSGQAHNNLQPYITCYMYKRVA